MSAFRPRILVLPFAALVIAGLVTFKLTRPAIPTIASGSLLKRPAPAFKALDMNNKLLKFERYIGRHEILLVFFDGELGADKDPLLARVRANFAQLQKRGLIVVAISAALPQHNREADKRVGRFPFPLLSDPEFLIHQSWGQYDEDRQAGKPALFLIDRAGLVNWSGAHPVAESDLNVILPQ